MLTPDALAAASTRAQALVTGLDGVIIGQGDLTRAVVTGLLAGGHVLLEGLPGLGKTELVKALAHLTGLSSQRVQFTPDLLPSDITGTLVLDRERQMTFRRGPLFAHLVLADEINRASPKTQSALLQAMAERQVTVFDQTHDLPRPFFVLATQNPVEQDGTYPLPEAQLDRFTLKLTITGLATDDLARLLTERPTGTPPVPAAATDPAGLADLMTAAGQIVVAPGVATYIARLVNATRPECGHAAATASVRWGASPRAALALAACARAAALLAGRPAVGFGDVKALAVPVIAHRLVLSHEAALAGTTAATVVERLVAELPEVA